MEIYPKLIAQNPALQLRKGGRFFIFEKIWPYRLYRYLKCYGTNSGSGYRSALGFDDQNPEKLKIVFSTYHKKKVVNIFMTGVQVFFFVVVFYTFPASDLNPQYWFLTFILKLHCHIH
jgi:hypothetical protein